MFGLGRRRAEDGRRREVEAWVRAAGGLTADTVVKVNELLCPDPACPGYETVVLVMEPGRRTRARKIAKPLDAVTAADVADALAR